MKRTLIVFLLVNLMLSACAPVSAPTPTPAPSATPLPTAIAAPTITPTATPTATPTPIPTIQVGNLSVPDPRVTNPELFDLRKPDAPIQQFVNAMKGIGITVDPNQVASELAKNYQVRQSANGKTYVLTTYAVKGDNDVHYSMGFIAEQNKRGEWRWKRALLHDLIAMNQTNVLVSIGIDMGDKNHNDRLYLDRALEGNTIFVTGGLSHGAIRWGRIYVPQVVREYHSRFTNQPLTIAGASLFDHHDQNIPSMNSEREARDFMRTRVREVLEILAPFIKDNNDRALIAIANEAFSGFGGSSDPYVGWDKENFYNTFYQLFGEGWLAEAYLTFEEVREEMGLPRENFTIYINDYGVELPGRKSVFFRQQVIETKQRIAQRLEIPWEQVQLDIGLQCHNMYDIPTDRQIYQLMQTEEGRAAIADNVNRLARETRSRVFFTEVTSKQQSVDFIIKFIDMARRIENLGGVNIWDALRTNPGTLGGETIWNKQNYQPTAAYYRLFDFLLGWGR
jgi:hypothetical protein